MKGYIQVYTGNGKGKTTAALGLALRAAGAGKKVFIGQFVKGMSYAEIKIIKSALPAIVLKQYGRTCFIHQKPEQADIDAARRGLLEMSEIIRSEEFDIVVMDEVTIALHFGLFSTDELIGILKSKPFSTEIIITGRYAPEKIIELADLVTEMKEVKHYYNLGVEAREGIEF
jgi:cob(I)alamin adenosyltransferase